MSMDANWIAAALCGLLCRVRPEALAGQVARPGTGWVCLRPGAQAGSAPAPVSVRAGLRRDQLPLDLASLACPHSARSRTPCVWARAHGIAASQLKSARLALWNVSRMTLHGAARLSAPGVGSLRANRETPGFPRRAVVSFPFPEAEKQFPPAEPVARVHFEEPDRRAPGGCLAHDPCAVTSEVVLPPVMARVEEWSDLAGVGVEAGEVGAFLVIALRAGEREFGRVVRAAVLTGEDVFDVESERGGVLRQPAVFTAMPGALADKFAGGAVHSGRLGVGEEGVGLGLKHTEQSVGPDHGFEFGLFVRGQLALGALGGELVVAALRFSVGFFSMSCFLE